MANMYILILALFITTVRCANILGMFLYPSISHQSVYHRLMRELSLKGHQVTIITPNPLHDATLTNLTEISMRSAYDVFQDRNVQKFFAKDLGFCQIMENLYTLLDIIAEKELNNSAVQKFLADKDKKFDIILKDLMHPVLYALSKRYQAPIVGVRSMSIFAPQNDAVGNPNHPILYPEQVLSFPPQRMTMWEKIQSIYYFLWNKNYYHKRFVPNAQEIATRYFGDGVLINEIETDVSMFFINRNLLLPPPKPNVPSIVEMMPLEFKRANALPSDLQQILDQSPEGVIYVSFGSNVKSAQLEKNIRNDILNAMAELPYKVLWKWESDYLPDKPANVITRKWFPQSDLLAHSNIRVFVTHGGLQSIEEAIARAVPLIGIPFYADQPRNVRRIVELGIGEKIILEDLTQTKLKNMIIQVAENRSYNDNMKKVRNVFFDKPLTGLQSVVWWTEYIIRHQGAKHLKSSAIKMSLFQYLMLDILLIFIVGIGLSVLIIYKMFLIIQKQWFVKKQKIHRFK